MILKLVPFTKEYLDLSWEWLNDPEIKNLTLTPDFSREDQLSFFESLSNKYDYQIHGIQVDELPAGACGLKNITYDSAEYWGYIGIKKFWGLGLGKQVVDQMEFIAKSRGISTIYLKVSDNNLRAINLYRSAGFEFQKNVQGLLTLKKAILLT